MVPPSWEYRTLPLSRPWGSWSFYADRIVRETGLQFSSFFHFSALRYHPDTLAAPFVDLGRNRFSDSFFSFFRSPGRRMGRKKYPTLFLKSRPQRCALSYLQSPRLKLHTEPREGKNSIALLLFCGLDFVHILLTDFFLAPTMDWQYTVTASEGVSSYVRGSRWELRLLQSADRKIAQRDGHGPPKPC